MRIIEILLPRGASDRSLSSKQVQNIQMLQQRMNSYVDRIMDPKTSLQGKEFLKARLRDDYYDLKDAMSSVTDNSNDTVMEAVHKVPLTNADFDLVKELMERPIPAAIAPIYLLEIFEDDEFSDMMLELEESDPGRDVRPLVVDWFNRVMPDQMHHFGQPTATYKQKMGMYSPVHGYDPDIHKGGNMTDTESSGNAYGYF